MNRKIIISGCSNCPYLTVWNNGEEKGIESIVYGSCEHPSFDKELLKPRFKSTIFFKYEIEDTERNRIDMSNVAETIPDGMPTWCPLPFDK
jgi:PHP family Zn ribbon phosphoesterase